MGQIVSLHLSVRPHIQRIPVIRRPGRKADYSPPYLAEVKNEWSSTYTPTYAFMTFTACLMHLTLCMLSDRNLRMWL
jgi:hypothetical protein